MSDLENFYIHNLSFVPYFETSVSKNFIELQGFILSIGKNLLFTLIIIKIPFRVLRYFTHKASVTSVNTEANVHSADWLMSACVNELGSLVPTPCTQSTRSAHAAVPKDYERDFQHILHL